MRSLNLIVFLLVLLAYAHPSLATSNWSAKTNSPAVNTQSTLNALNIFRPSDNTCATDVSSELSTFLTNHDGKAVIRDGDCLLLGDMGSTIVSTTSMNLKCERAGACTIKFNNDDNALLYWVPDNIALDQKALVTAVGTATINKDDAEQHYIQVADASGYSRGDLIKIAQSIGVSDDPPSTKTISDVSWDAGNSKCVITTSSSHGYSSSHRIFIKGITATVGGTKIDYLDGSDGYGRTYNITLGDGTGANTSTKFTLQTLDNSTDTTSGADVNCDTGVYASGGVTSRQNTWASEASKVTGVDLVQDRIFLETPLVLKDLYVVDSATGNVPVLYRYTKARTFSIDGFYITSNGTPDDPTMTVSDSAVDVMGVPFASYTNNTFDNLWDAGIFDRGNPFSLQQGNKSRNMLNMGTVDSSTNSKIITNISRASQAVITFYNESGSTSGASNNSDVSLVNMPAGDWQTINNKLYRISDASGSNCKDALNTCTFKPKDTYGNYIDTSAFATAYSGTSTVGDPVNVTGLGYQTSHQSSAYQSIVRDMSCVNGRHCFTTGTSQLSWSATLSSSPTLVRFGVPTYGKVMRGNSSGAFGRVWDTHEATYKYIFKDLIAEGSMRGPTFGSYEGACGQDRGADNTWENITCDRQKQGIRFVANHRFKPAEWNLKDISCMNSKSTDGSDKCVEIQDWSSYTNKPTFNISGYFNTTGVSIPLSIGKTAIVRSTANMRFVDFDDAVNCQAGSTFESMGLMFTDFRDPGNASSWTHKSDVNSDGFNSVVMRSDGTYGGCTARVRDAVNFQGTGSNKLTNLFYRADTTATKYYSIEKFTEYDPSSVGNSLLVSSPTTMTKLTDRRTMLDQTNNYMCPLSYRSGKYYGPWSTASWSTLALSANTQYFVPIYICKPVTLSGMAFYQTAGAASVNYRVGLYKASVDGSAPTSIVSGTDTAGVTTGAAGKVDVAFAATVTITEPGWYWAQILSDGAMTITATSNFNQTGHLFYGAEDIGANSTGTGLQPTISTAYGALPSTAGSLVYGSSGTNSVALFVKVN